MDWYKQAKSSEQDSVKSSWISDISYLEFTGKLEVRLKSGQTYTYQDVPSNVYENFLESKSKGEFFNRVIKKNYKVKV